MVKVQADVRTPIVPIWMSERTGEGHRTMIEGGLAPMRSVNNAVGAIRRFMDYGRWRASQDATWSPLGSAASSPPSTVTLTEAAAKGLLRQAGIPVPNGVVVNSPADAARAFGELACGKVAMKVVSASITHKTDVGGVQLGIASEQAAGAAFDAILARVGAAHDTSAIEGVLVEPMLEGPFIETVIGIHRDPVFGHICTFGLGGVSIELFKDLSRRLLPLTPQSARAMIAETRCWQILAGHRGQAAYDIDALVETLVRLSDFVVRHASHVEELEINPLAVRPQGRGVAALDAVLTCQASEQHEW
jgi:acyl-CoA synthetase (NDP forming)